MILLLMYDNECLRIASQLAGAVGRLGRRGRAALGEHAALRSLQEVSSALHLSMKVLTKD